ncbi:FMN-dependent NADH-azoreductase [Priestia megaterium]|jgi:FMN-dependent NADH-azoreductase|uniref:FMN-dependent NADH-azoreductase n=1 Tax=Priestia megaterium TaxID=1404 RepID=UPI0007098C07|nr:FMN-dependent NADH-azoreductase [Priestia megaterium]KRD95319.1 FMN-dependent NADH-azoreductase [Bacillus sp. Root239]MCM3019620.1 FMN-dependent NADH-azoreductase [Priestia megaterium]MCM3185489.1 FMN-dependent NADH-azoreductase [Priestia megaterium]MCM3195974.1 FMN-dependent NADH-azoreductase [Priestia megaterium]MED3913728.1 FMN-dependent NADH-azoreductase [Priestia megaterium]
MSYTLFIKANDRSASEAVSVKLYDAFLESYRQSHQDEEIIELNLFKEELPYLGADMINGQFKLARGLEVTAAENKAAETANYYLEQFVRADKIVIAFPLWNFTVPAVLHTYFDYLNQAGKTFKYTPEGPVGLLGDKKVMLLNARGGVYSEGPAAEVEMAVKYVGSVLQFFGITDVNSVIIEGHNQFPDRAQEIIESGLEKAAQSAKTF